ncbi:hypothetical protein K502DRAFT_237984 [Neoconidiobolus thromboides FSU 785]|nr:hypothetical protein K502DRAFT_237984 [Neoconidiobolus thromboides FSU 785]
MVKVFVTICSFLNLKNRIDLLLIDLLSANVPSESILPTLFLINYIWNEPFKYDSKTFDIYEFNEESNLLTIVYQHCLAHIFSMNLKDEENFKRHIEEFMHINEWPALHTWLPLGQLYTFYLMPLAFKDEFVSKIGETVVARSLLLLKNLA